MKNYGPDIFSTGKNCFVLQLYSKRKLYSSIWKNFLLKILLTWDIYGNLWRDKTSLRSKWWPFTKKCWTKYRKCYAQFIEAKKKKKILAKLLLSRSTWTAKNLLKKEFNLPWRKTLNFAKCFFAIFMVWVNISHKVGTNYWCMLPKMRTISERLLNISSKKQKFHSGLLNLNFPIAEKVKM